MVAADSPRVLDDRITADEAARRWKRHVTATWIMTLIATTLIAALTWYGWGSASAGTRVGMVLFIAVLLGDGARNGWLEWHDPTLCKITDGVLTFHRISAPPIELPVTQVQCVKVHENPYLKLRRAYSKWFEVETRSSRIIVAASNLTAEAHHCLSGLRE